MLLGCNAYALGSCAGEAEEQAYRRQFAALLNYATLPFYLGSYEREQGKPDRQRLTEMAQWCRQNGITTKGHPLVWHEASPPWLADKSTAQVADIHWKRIEREVKAFGGLIDIWDVVNEAVIMPTFGGGENPLSRLCRELGQVELIKRSFECARAANPRATLLLNDFDTSEAYATLIDQCLQAGIRIDAVGIQSHMHRGYWGPAKTREVLERFSRFALPLHFTELTILSGRLKPMDDNDWHKVRTDWPSTPEGERLAAIQGGEFYTTLMAHPLVKAITWWDFSDYHAWQGAPAGLLRRDMSPKPLYAWLKNSGQSTVSGK
jgi:GH35 family endo-1,4-beta-xylanase